MARGEIADVQSGGRLPILVGGTGLYIRALLDGIAPVPPIDAEVRARVRARPVQDNRAELERLDPQAAERLDPADSARIARALEVALSTGRTLADWQEQREGGIGGQVELKALILLPPRQWLYARCDKRFEAMVENGAVEEVKGAARPEAGPRPSGHAGDRSA
jgi:tRNA dimethylallyltransferase